MAENEGVELVGEAGVFPSLLSDNAPSGTGEVLPAPDSVPTGEQTLQERLTGKTWDGMGIGRNENWRI